MIVIDCFLVRVFISREGLYKMIETQKLDFSYGSNHVLQNISFTANKGEITYLAGVNGAGKTTWIKCAVGLLIPKSGSVLYDNKYFSDVRNEFAICFDTPPIYKNMSCYDNLSVLYDVNPKKQETRDLLEKVGISETLLKKPAGRLSFGQRHRLGIAGAILRNPKYLIMDEPDLGLDPVAWEVVKNEIIRLKKNGSVIILTGQNFVQLEEIIDKIVLLSDKKIMSDLSVNDFIQKYNNGDENKSLKNAFLKAIE